MNKLLTLFTILLSLCSCSTTTTISLPTDNINSSKDFELILDGISKKTQSYTLQKVDYKTNQRKKALKKIEALSNKAYSLFINESINEEKFNRFHKEAKYVIQQVIFMIKNETSIPTQEDNILKYLNTGINSLNDILTN